MQSIERVSILSVLLFELQLFDGDIAQGLSLDAIPKTYARLLTDGTLFHYDADGWSRDVDAGFYVADYFTAWALEAQLRDYLCKHFGSEAVEGEDWWQNPKAGDFLKSLWTDGNIPQQQLADRLGYGGPAEVGPLLKWMERNLKEGVGNF